MPDRREVGSTGFGAATRAPGRYDCIMILDSETKAVELPEDHGNELRLWLRLLTCTTLIDGEGRSRRGRAAGRVRPSRPPHIGHRPPRPGDPIDKDRPRRISQDGGRARDLD